MLAQTFSYNGSPIKMHGYSISFNGNIHVDISNIRKIGKKYYADLAYEEEYITTANGVDTDSLRYRSSKQMVHDISPATENPMLFLTKFGKEWFPFVTNATLTFKINGPDLDAPKNIDEFFREKLNAVAIKGYWKKIESSLKKKENIDYIKDRTVLKFIDNSSPLKVPMLKVASISFLKNAAIFIPVAFLLAVIGPALGLSVTVLYVLTKFLLVCIPYRVVESLLIKQKQKADIVKKLYNLDNFSTTTPESKSDLESKLLLSFYPCAEADKHLAAIEIGEKSYNSYFNYFKSFFNKNAYHYAYYLGNEMAAKKKCMPRL